MRRNATATTPTTVVGQQQLRVKKVERDESADEREEFSAVILTLPTGEVAKTIDVSKETVRTWKRGDALPSYENTAALIAAYPQIAHWHAQRYGHFESPQALTASLTAFTRLLDDEGPKGKAMWAIIRAKQAEREGD